MVGLKLSACDGSAKLPWHRWSMLPWWKAVAGAWTNQRRHSVAACDCMVQSLYQFPPWIEVCSPAKMVCVTGPTKTAGAVCYLGSFDLKSGPRQRHELRLSKLRCSMPSGCEPGHRGSGCTQPGCFLEDVAVLIKPAYQSAWLSVEMGCVKPSSECFLRSIVLLSVSDLACIACRMSRASSPECMRLAIVLNHKANNAALQGACAHTCSYLILGEQKLSCAWVSNSPPEFEDFTGFGLKRKQLRSTMRVAEWRTGFDSKLRCRWLDWLAASEISRPCAWLVSRAYRKCRAQ